MALVGGVGTTLLLQHLVVAAVCFIGSHSMRFGQRADYLHFPKLTDEEIFGPRTKVITVPAGDVDLVLENALRFEPQSPGGGSHSRVRRSATSTTTPPSSVGDTEHPTDPEVLHQNITTQVDLKDGHHLMMVHWAGKGSPVILALAKDMHQANTSNSSLYVSDDYGTTFKKQSLPDLMCDGSGALQQAVIEKFYHNDVDDNVYVFTDTLHDALLTTTDSGTHYSVHCLPFTPRTITLHPRNFNIMLGYDKEDTSKRLYITTNFGFSWQVLERNVKSFYWGIPPYDGENELYIERIEAYGSNKVLKWLDVRYPQIYTYATMEVIDRVEDFEVRDSYMFATRRVVSIKIEIT